MILWGRLKIFDKKWELFFFLFRPKFEIFPTENRTRSDCSDCQCISEKPVEDKCITTMGKVRKRYLEEQLTRERIKSKTSAKAILATLISEFTPDTATDIAGDKKLKRNLRDQARYNSRKALENEDGSTVVTRYSGQQYSGLFCESCHLQKKQ